jgi:hypothetical protein
MKDFDYSEYISNHIDTSIRYSKYIAESIITDYNLKFQSNISKTQIERQLLKSERIAKLNKLNNL